MTGYARMDFRVRADGTTYFLEANANPNVEEEEDFAYAALESGMDYSELLERIIALGLNYRAKRRQD
jgi:D-alanine-D-alanine ligase